MGDLVNEKERILLLLAGLLEFNGKEKAIEHMSRVLKLEEPEYQDVYTIKGFHYLREEPKVGDENVPRWVFKYDERNVDMTRLVGESVCWRNPDYQRDQHLPDGDPPADGEIEPYIYKTKLKIKSVDHAKREFIISRNKNNMEDKLKFLQEIDALTEFSNFNKKDFQDSVERIVNAYLNKLGLEGEGAYLEALAADTEDEDFDAEDYNELAFSLIEKSSLTEEVSGEFDSIVANIRKLDNSYLAVQGPPGTGKTFTGANIIHELLTSGGDHPIKIGITAQSYAAIDNLLLKTVGVFKQEGTLSKLRAYRNESKLQENLRSYFADESVESLSHEETDETNLVAAVGWTFAKRKEDSEKFDYLFIDEAGQFSLFDAIACCASTKNLVLLGDPQQLSQVTQASHDFGAGQSVLEYLIGNNDVIPKDMGVLLDTTYRLRPEICKYISSEFYDGRLHVEKRCRKREIVGRGNGIFWIDAKHANECVNQSHEEAEIVKQVIAELMHRKFYEYSEVTDERVESVLTPENFMVVSPYNAHRNEIGKTLRSEFPEVVVGTVDKFQGKEAPVVIYSMATSNRDLVPPGRSDFIYKPNRLNVAISRAQCLAIVIANRELVEAHAANIPEMEDLNHLCRIFEDKEIAREWAL
tara:strand:+ start:2216 stop:4135 length:1920 start_codon:yes stop_codon:yes gene_type:complete